MTDPVVADVLGDAHENPPVDDAAAAAELQGDSAVPLDRGVPTVIGIDPQTGDARLLNRELTWLDFNTRVLALAQSTDVPLLERTKFLAIFSQNLDEFFQVRVAGIKDQVAAGVIAPSPDGRTPTEQLEAVRGAVATLVRRQQSVFAESVAPALADAGIILSSYADLDDEEDVTYLDDLFERRIFPVLTPLAVDPGHPFPYISHLSLNLAVVVRDPITAQRRFARVKVPSVLDRFIVLPDGERFVPLEQVIAAHVDRLFPGMEVLAHHAFRVTRNADLTLEEDEADDLLAAVEMELRRHRFRRAVRLEIDADTSDEVAELLQRELDLEDQDVYRIQPPVDLSGLWAVWALDRPELKDAPFSAVTPPELAERDGERTDFFEVLRHQDVLVHHPYDRFSTTVEEFIAQASLDPKVLAIKLTLYRTSGGSPIVRSLIRAAERGKQVAALVELTARGDEQANIGWARALEEAGVHVVYGLVGLKTHTKTMLVVRDDADGIRRYAHIGTGNYNSKTAKLYEDLGLLTSDPQLGQDLSNLFNFLTGYGRNVRYEKLLVSPHSMRSSMRRLIAGEMEAARRAPGSGRIRAKMNSLVDADMIEALYEASCAGVEIDLVVRGMCCLRPGVPGLSERIRVRSLVGRYLEHSRIFEYANGGGPGTPAYFLGSADWMPRNLDRRVEAITPVDDLRLQARLCNILDVNLADDVLAWELQPDGTWSKVPTVVGNDTHLILQAQALER